MGSAISVLTPTPRPTPDARTISSVPLRPYHLHDPPIAVEFREMSAADAKRYFEWFMADMPFRMSQLASTISEDLGEPWCPDGSDASLRSLGRWLHRNVVTRPVRTTELESIRALGGLVDHIPLPDKTLDATSMSIAIDCGTYAAEVLRMRHKQLLWCSVEKPPSHVDYHRPVLAGFRFDVVFEPIRMGTVQADKVWRQPGHVPDFVDLVQVWEQTYA